MIFVDARNCSPASLDRIVIPSPPSLGLRERTSLGMLFGASVPNNAGMNFSARVEIMFFREMILILSRDNHE